MDRKLFDEDDTEQVDLGNPYRTNNSIDYNPSG